MVKIFYLKDNTTNLFQVRQSEHLWNPYHSLYVFMICKYLAGLAEYLNNIQMFNHNLRRSAGFQASVALREISVFPSQFKFHGIFVSLSPRLKYSDRNKFLYMARQLCCRGTCKKLLRSYGQQRNYSKANFHRIWIAGQKSLVKRALGPAGGHWPWYWLTDNSSPCRLEATNQPLYTAASSNQVGRVCTWHISISFEPNIRSTKETSVPNRRWRGCVHPAPNWSY